MAAQRKLLSLLLIFFLSRLALFAQDCTDKPDATIIDANGGNFIQCSSVVGSYDFEMEVQNASTTASTNKKYVIEWGDGTKNTYDASFSHATHTYKTRGKWEMRLTVTSESGCESTSTYQVFNGSNPKFGLQSPGNTSDCAPATFTFNITDNTFSNSPSTTYKIWFDDGTDTLYYSQSNLPRTITHTFTESTADKPNGFTLTGVAIDCFNRKTPATISGIIVSSKPIAAFSFTTPELTCINTLVQFKDESKGGFNGNNPSNSGAYRRKWSISPATGWSFANGTNASSERPQIIFTKSGKYEVSLQIDPVGNSATCQGDRNSQFIYIEDPAKAAFKLVPGQQDNCTPNRVAVENLSTGTNVKYKWSISPLEGVTFEKSDTLANPEFLFTKAGTYKVTLTTQNSCGITTATEDITIRDIPLVTIPPTAEYCGPQSIVFGPSNSAHNPTYDPQNGTISRYHWIVEKGYGDTFESAQTSDEANPTFQFTEPGIYKVRVQAWNECGVSTEVHQIITIHALPKAPTVNVNPTPVCKGSEAVLTASSEGATSYKWYTAGGTTPITKGVSEDGTTFTTSALSETTTFFVEAISENGCVSSERTEVIVTVQQPPVAPVVANNPAICAGSTASLQTSVPDAKIEWYTSAKGGTPFFVGEKLDTVLTTTTTFYVGSISVVGGCPSVSRTEVTVTVEPAITNNEITTENKGICENSETGIIKASVPAGGSGKPAYQWQLSVNGKDFDNIAEATEQNLPSRVLTATTWFRRVVTLGACSAITDTVKFTTVPPVTNNVLTASPEAICAGTTPSPITSDPIIGGDGSEPTIVWESSTKQDGKFTEALGSGTTTSFQPEAMSKSLWFRRRIIFNGCESISEAVEIKVNPLSLPPTVVGVRDTICSGGTAELKAIAPSGPYSWYDAATEGNLLAISETFITPVLTNFTNSPITVTFYVQSEATGGCTVKRTAVNVVVEPQINNNIIEDVARICAGESPTIKGQQPTGGSGAPVYVWQFSTDKGENKIFKDITGKGSINYTANNLTETTWFRRKVVLGTCEDYSNVVKVDVTPALANNVLPASAKFCEGTTPPVLQEKAGVSVTGGDPVEGIQYRWEIKTTANGTFEAAPGENTGVTYQPVSITQPTTWFRRVAISGSCTLESNVIELYMAPRPAAPVVAKTNLEVCLGGGAILTASPVNGVTFQWFNQAGTFLQAGNTFTIPAADLTEVKTYTYFVESKSADACVSSERVTVKVTVLPVLTETIAYGEQVVCRGSAPAKALTASAPTGGNGKYHYQWQFTTDITKPFKNTSSVDTLASFQPGALTVNTWFRRVVKSGDCEENSTEVKITVTEPVVNTIAINSGSADVCYDVQPSVVLGGKVSGGDGKNYSYQWQYRTNSNQPFVNTSAKDTLATYSPAAAKFNTQYRRIVTSGACDAAESNIVELYVNPIPAAPVAQGDTVCTGSKARLSANGDGTIQWLDAKTGAILYTGRSSSVFETPVLTATTTYHVRVISAALCVGPVTAVTVVVEEKISHNTIEDVADVCYATIPDILIGSSPKGGNGNYEYQWYIKPKNKSTYQEIPGATNKDYQHTQVLLMDTKFKRSVKAGTCAEDLSQEIEIKVNMPLAEGSNYITPKEQNRAAGTKPSLLKGSAVPADNTIQWWHKAESMTSFEPITGATARDYQPGTLQETTQYMRQVKSNTGGCFSYSDTVQVTIFKAFTSNTIAGGGEACYNEPFNITINGNQPEGNLADVQYYWEKRTENSDYATIVGASANKKDYQVPALDATTWYRRKVTVNGVTTTSNEVKVQVYKRITINSVTASAEVACVGSVPGKIVGSTPEGGNGTYKYVWEKSTISATNDASFTAVTGVSADLKDYVPAPLDKTAWFRRRVISGNCVSEPSTPVRITATPLPTAPTVRDVFSCAGEAATLIASSNGTTIEWYDQAQGGKLLTTGTSYTTPVLTKSATYYVQTVSQNCNSERVAVKVNVPDPTANAGNDVAIGLGKFIELRGDGGTSYQWSPSTGLSNANIANPTAKPTETTTYTLTVTSPDGCTSTDQVTVTVLPLVDVPNGFTPNGDGYNDTWEVENLKNYPNCRVEIFNRWGNKVFESKGYTKPWDGRNGGQPLPPATYYYLIHLDQNEKPISGNVTIIK